MPVVLVTGATGRIGSAVVELLLDAGVPTRALTRRPAAAASMPRDVEVFVGDFTQPESLDVALKGVDTVFLVWTAPPATAPPPRPRPSTTPTSPLS